MIEQWMFFSLSANKIGGEGRGEVEFNQEPLSSDLRFATRNFGGQAGSLPARRLRGERVQTLSPERLH
jgi:hypothetical protein